MHANMSKIPAHVDATSVQVAQLVIHLLVVQSENSLSTYMYVELSDNNAKQALLEQSELQCSIEDA